MFGMRARHEQTSKQCPHNAPLPRWDRVEDIGDHNHVSRYYCATCNSFLPPDAATDAARQEPRPTAA